MIDEVQPGVVVVGTAHISPTSVREVEETLRARRPRKVLVELDPARRKALEDPDTWANTDIFRILKEKKQHLFLVQLYLASMQARMGRETGIPPGTELLRAIQVAGEVGAEVVLIDRDVAVTLKRGFAAMGLWARVRLFWNVWSELMTPADDSKPAPTVEDLLKSDDLSRMTDEFARFAPQVKVALIDERDAYMASHIAQQAATLAPGESLVAVVGAGHLAGIRNRLKAPASADERKALDAVPQKRVSASKVLGWAVPILLVAGFVWVGYTKDWNAALDEVVWFVVVSGSLAALGAALAFGHPYSIATAFVAAPFAILHPLVAAGWFAGLVEAKVRTPKVADFQAVKHIETMGQFWRNGVVRVLLVTALANLGAMVASGVILTRLGNSLGG